MNFYPLCGALPAISTCVNGLKVAELDTTRLESPNCPTTSLRMSWNSATNAGTSLWKPRITTRSSEGPLGCRRTMPVAEHRHQGTQHVGLATDPHALTRRAQRSALPWQLGNPSRCSPPRRCCLKCQLDTSRQRTCTQLGWEVVHETATVCSFRKRGQVHTWYAIRLKPEPGGRPFAGGTSRVSHRSKTR